MIPAKRDYRSSWPPSPVAVWQGPDNPDAFVVVCLWSVVGTALTTLVMWLALGGAL
jgi:hypothetical protein